MRRIFYGEFYSFGNVAALAFGVAAIVMVPSTLHGILSSSFLPHAYCYLYDKQLIALNAGSDIAIWISYIAISCTLVYLVWRTRREIPFSWMFLAFGLFIVACGFTHLMEVIVLWKPFYWLAGDVKLITAGASLVTAIALPGLIPQIHSMVTAAHLSEDRRTQLEQANTDLQHLSGRVMVIQDEERRRIAARPVGFAPGHVDVKKVHRRRADEGGDELTVRPVEDFARASDLFDQAVA